MARKLQIVVTHGKKKLYEQEADYWCSIGSKGEGMNMKLSWKNGIAVTVLILALMSLGKYAMYELTGAASRLRNSVGKTIVLPQVTYRVLGKDVTIGERQGVLQSVSYKWNDKFGFFDLKVDYASASAGLSPSEARRVTIRDTNKVQEDTL
jgi:hypothetical protein